MSKYGGLYSGTYLKAVDLKNQYTPVILTDVRPEGIKQQNGPDRQMLCVGFRGAEQRLILNTTNYNTLVELLGENEDAWENQRVQLWKTMTEYGGKMVPAIRIVAAEQTAPPPGQGPVAQAIAAAAQTPAQPPAQGGFSPPAEPEGALPPGGPGYDDDDAPPFL